MHVVMEVYAGTYGSIPVSIRHVCMKYVYVYTHTHTHTHTHVYMYLTPSISLSNPHTVMLLPPPLLLPPPPQLQSDGCSRVCRVQCSRVPQEVAVARYAGGWFVDGLGVRVMQFMSPGLVSAGLASFAVWCLRWL